MRWGSVRFAVSLRKNNLITNNYCCRLRPYFFKLIDMHQIEMSQHAYFNDLEDGRLRGLDGQFVAYSGTELIAHAPNKEALAQVTRSLGINVLIIPVGDDLENIDNVR